MKIIDLTVALDENASIYPQKEYKAPDFVYVLDPTIDPAGRYASDIRVMVHTGTHIDTPKHFNNKSTTSEMSLEVICGEAIVCKLPRTISGPITKEMVASMIPDDMETAGKRLVLMCGYNNALWGSDEYYSDHTAYVSPELAAWIVEKGFVLVGLDMLTDGLPGFPVHHKLLDNHVYILECLTNYDAIPEGVSIMTLITAPLPLVNREAAPVRAFLIR